MSRNGIETMNCQETIRMLLITLQLLRSKIGLVAQLVRALC